jgi:hypothetical protein
MMDGRMDQTRRRLAEQALSEAFAVGRLTLGRDGEASDGDGGRACKGTSGQCSEQRRAMARPGETMALQPGEKAACQMTKGCTVVRVGNISMTTRGARGVPHVDANGRRNGKVGMSIAIPDRDTAVTDTSLFFPLRIDMMCSPFVTS